MQRFSAWGAMLALGVPLAYADAIPAPEDVSDLQKALIGTWHEDSCVMPQGLGHGCLQRVYVFGNEGFAEAQFSAMSMSNTWGSFARNGQWTATRVDAKTVKVSVTFTDNSTADLTLTLDSDRAFQLVSASDFAMFPPTHFTRLGDPVTPWKP